LHGSANQKSKTVTLHVYKDGSTFLFFFVRNTTKEVQYIFRKNIGPKYNEQCMTVSDNFDTMSQSQ